MGVAVLVRSGKVLSEISPHIKSQHWSRQMTHQKDVISLHRYKMDLFVHNADFLPKDKCYSIISYVSIGWFNVVPWCWSAVVKSEVKLGCTSRLCIEVLMISLQDVISLHWYKMDLLDHNVDFQLKDNCYSNISYVSIVWFNVGATMLVHSGKVCVKIRLHLKTLLWSGQMISLQDVIRLHRY